MQPWLPAGLPLPPCGGQTMLSPGHLLSSGVLHFTCKHVFEQSHK